MIFNVFNVFFNKSWKNKKFNTILKSTSLNDYRYIFISPNIKSYASFLETHKCIHEEVSIRASAHAHWHGVVFKAHY